MSVNTDRISKLVDYLGTPSQVKSNLLAAKHRNIFSDQTVEKLKQIKQALANSNNIGPAQIQSVSQALKSRLIQDQISLESPQQIEQTQKIIVSLVQSPVAQEELDELPEEENVQPSPKVLQPSQVKQTLTIAASLEELPEQVQQFSRLKPVDQGDLDAIETDKDLPIISITASLKNLPEQVQNFYQTVKNSSQNLSRTESPHSSSSPVLSTPSSTNSVQDLLSASATNLRQLIQSDDEEEDSDDEFLKELLVNELKIEEEATRNTTGLNQTDLPKLGNLLSTIRKENQELPQVQEETPQDQPNTEQGIDKARKEKAANVLSAFLLKRKETSTPSPKTEQQKQSSVIAPPPGIKEKKSKESVIVQPEEKLAAPLYEYEDPKHPNRRCFRDLTDPCPIDDQFSPLRVFFQEKDTKEPNIMYFFFSSNPSETFKYDINNPAEILPCEAPKNTTEAPLVPSRTDRKPLSKASRRASAQLTQEEIETALSQKPKLWAKIKQNLSSKKKGNN